MPLYVYGCGRPGHPRLEIVHGFDEDHIGHCEKCGELLHRIPQSTTWYRNPYGVLLDYMDDKYRDWRVRNERKRKRKAHHK